MFWVVASIILLILMAVLLYDFSDALFNWIGRIKIGSITNDLHWINATEQVISKWFVSGAPKVRLNDNKRLKLIDDIKNRSGSSVKYWQDAALMKAADYMESDMKDKAERMLNRYIDISTGEWKTEPERIDSAMLAFEFMYSQYIDNNTIEPAMTFLAEKIKEKFDIFGTVPYNDSISDVRFVDTIGMICPFLIEYAKDYSKPEYVSLAVSQMKEYERFGIHKELNIPVHCFDSVTKAPLGIYGWGRGCAWWAVGLLDSMKALYDQQGFNSEKIYILRTMCGFLDNMMKYVRDDGSIGRIITCDSLQDSSAASMLAYCFACAYTLTQNDDYRCTAVKMLENLKKCTRRDGVIDYSQGDTMGIGFYSDSLIVMPATQGFAVCANGELIN